VREQRQALPARQRVESFLFLGGPKPTFESPCVKLPSGLVVHKVNAAFLQNLTKGGVKNIESVAKDCAVCIQFTATDSTRDLLRSVAFNEALVLITDVRSREAGHIIREINSRRIISTSDADMRGGGTVLWGHFLSELSMANIEAADKLLPRIEPLHVAEKFSRVGNAAAFYRNGYNSDNADLALISFTTCLESLFSTVEQELSFRLSLRVATFLADENAKRKQLFEEAKDVYRIRSKVVHGAKIHKDSETAAIILVDGVLPNAERLARKCLAKVLEMQVENIFENSEKLNELFEELIFSNSLEKALLKMR
jgi:Apea-like HEPN